MTNFLQDFFTRLSALFAALPQEACSALILFWVACFLFVGWSAVKASVADLPVNSDRWS